MPCSSASPLENVIVEGVLAHDFMKCLPTSGSEWWTHAGALPRRMSSKNHHKSPAEKLAASGSTPGPRSMS